jgi:hypothetical protein
MFIALFYVRNGEYEPVPSDTLNKRDMGFAGWPHAAWNQRFKGTSSPNTVQNCVAATASSAPNSWQRASGSYSAAAAGHGAR